MTTMMTHRQPYVLVYDDNDDTLLDDWNQRMNEENFYPYAYTEPTSAVAALFGIRVLDSTLLQ